ncbi:MAG: sugar-binding protein [Planctomycetes bacterium]|nr:sugar-binding protein [Planctomycetota bacterium]
MRSTAWRLCVCLGVALSAATCDSKPKLQLAFVINNASDFWTFARAGIRKAERELDVEVDFQTPGQGTAAQQRQIIETLIAKGVQGMAVSVLDPKGAVEILNDAAKRMPVVTQDSDCPDSKRVAYIGTDNVDAGRAAGREIKKALPEGGKIALFVGKLDVANAYERKKGIEEAIAGSGVEIVETFTDEGQRPTAQTNVRNSLDKYPDLKCLVGLWSYNAPAIIKVVQEKGLQGKIKIVAFDEESPTLDGIEDGTVQSTVVQQPFEFGYQSIRALAKLARKEDAGLPANGLAYVPVRVIDVTNLAEFREKVRQMLREGK